MAAEETQRRQTKVTITSHAVTIENLKEDLDKKEKRLAKVLDEKMQAQNEIATLQSVCQMAQQKLESANSAHAKELKTLRADFTREMEAKEKKLQDELAAKQTAYEKTVCDIMLEKD
ncbi:hypothetical protein R1flu_027633 [Riccia fluitans]|uniref:Uncharacterized protein n=1 Tax=Riccia fluitans TaxID=41844 RepID=A0ABD1XJG6_9MARC